MNTTGVAHSVFVGSITPISRLLSISTFQAHVPSAMFCTFRSKRVEDLLMLIQWCVLRRSSDVDDHPREIKLSYHSIELVAKYVQIAVNLYLLSSRSPFAHVVHV